jgi:hypothetical protein
VYVGFPARRIHRCFGCLPYIEEGSPIVFSLRVLAERILDERPLRSPALIADRLGLRIVEGDEPAPCAAFRADLLDSLLDRAARLGFVDLDGLERLCDEVPAHVDFGRFAFGRDDLAALPSRPGVYIMRDERGECVYVGKARRLKDRVGSYFRPSARADERVSGILEDLHSLEIVETGSELGALLAEHDHIAALRPRRNTQRHVHARWRKQPSPLAVLTGAPVQGELRLFVIADHGVEWIDFPRDAPPAEAFEQLVRWASRARARSSRTKRERAALALSYVRAARDRLAMVDLRLVVKPSEGAERLSRLARAVIEAGGGARVT